VKQKKATQNLQTARYADAREETSAILAITGLPTATAKKKKREIQISCVRTDFGN